MWNSLSYEHLHKNIGIIGHVNIEGESFHCFPSLEHEFIVNCWLVGEWEFASPRGKPPYWLSNTRWPSKKNAHTTKADTVASIYMQRQYIDYVAHNQR